MLNKRLSPVKAIKSHCLDCSGGVKKEVSECIVIDCPLYAFRLGRNPNRKLKKNCASTTEKKQGGNLNTKLFRKPVCFESAS